MKRLQLPSKESTQQALIELVTSYAQSSIPAIDKYVARLRSQNVGLSDDDLAALIVRRKSMKCGLIGAATGVPGILALPATIPADLIGCWRVQIVMAVAVARVYGHTPDSTDLKTDILLILAGDAANQVLKRVGIESGKHVTKRLVQKYVTREVMKKVWKVVPQKILTKAGEKSMFSFMKSVPLVGAPIGFAFDYPAAKTVGKVAIRYYSGGG